MKTDTGDTEIITFWSKFSGEHPILSSRAMRKLVPFPTTYMCETGFFAIVASKTKAVIRFIFGGDLRRALSLTKPGFKDFYRPNADSAHELIS